MITYTPPHHLVDSAGISYNNFNEDDILQSAQSLSNCDGRHSVITKKLGEYLSDYSLQRERVRIMILHIILFSELKDSPLSLSNEEKGMLLTLAHTFTEKDYIAIFQYDHIGRNGRSPLEHDVKAVELFLGEKFEGMGMAHVIPFIHILCTSEDVNNLSYQAELRNAINEVILPQFRGIIQSLIVLVDEYKESAILGRTHGQPAVPTTFGKLIATELENLSTALEPLGSLVFSGKFSGATGSNAAHMLAFPQVDWIEYEKKVVEHLGFRQKLCSDQRGPLVERVQLFHILKDVNNVLVNLSGKFWDLCARGILVQKSIPGEAGSSVMPGKTNPWRLEEAKGVFQMANALFSAFADNHLITHRERDLSEHPLERNYGEAFGQMLIGLTNFQEQLKRFEFSGENANNELNENPEILGEAIQTVLRSKHIPHAYDFLARFMKGRNVTLEDIRVFIDVVGASIEKKEKAAYRSRAMREMIDSLSPELREQFLSIKLESGTHSLLLGLDPKTYMGDAARRAKMSSQSVIAAMGKFDTKVTLCLARSRILAVGFDFDDTLYLGDKEELGARVNFMNDMSGIHLTEEQKRVICSMARWDEQKKLIRQYAQENGVELTDEKLEELQEEAKPYFSHILRMDEGSIEVLDLLKKKGIPSFLITNRGPKSLGHAFKKHGLHPLFQHVTDSSHALKKPDPTLMKEALAVLGITSHFDQVLYVGDNLEKDVQFARDAGVTPIWVNNGVNHENSGLMTVANMQEFFRTISLKLL